MLDINEQLLMREQLTPDLLQIVDAMDGLPQKVRDTLDPIVERLVRHSLIRRQALDTLHEAVTQLRLDVTYLQFDLECTRKERDEYRRMVE